MVFCTYFSLCADRISGIQLVILSFLRDQLVMSTALDDPSLFQNHDNIGVLNRRQTVGNGDGRPVFGQFFQAALDPAFALQGAP